MISPISTAPHAHSAPKPKPWIALVTRSCPKDWVKAATKVASANQRIVICSAFTRPIRSDSAPPSQPPMAEVTSVTPPTSPASVWLTPHVAISAGITRPNIWTSRASSAHPPKQVQNVVRSTALISLYHLNIDFPPACIQMYSHIVVYVFLEICSLIVTG